MKILFWLSIVGILYSYFLYPLILLLLPKSKYNYPDTCKDLPDITIIITAHNEKVRIRQKLDNTINLDYPNNKLEIIVASDSSTDSTDEIVRKYKDSGVVLVRSKERKGKEYAQLNAINKAKGDILVFSDVATGIDNHALETIAKLFTNDRIGAISSVDRFISEQGDIVGEGAYVKYEMWLRNLESNVYSLIGLSGSFFAARKCVCKEWDINVPSDFNTAINCIRNGYVAISNNNLVGTYKDLKNKKGEYSRKIRTIIRGITALSRNIDSLNPIRFGLFSFEIFSHKVMRWLVPWFMLLTLLTSFLLLHDGYVYLFLFGIQVMVYLILIFVLFIPKLQESTILRIPFYFVQVNLAIAHATILFLFGKRISVWSPSKR